MSLLAKLQASAPVSRVWFDNLTPEQQADLRAIRKAFQDRSDPMINRYSATGLYAWLAEQNLPALCGKTQFKEWLKKRDHDGETHEAEKPKPRRHAKG